VKHVRLMSSSIWAEFGLVAAIVIGLLLSDVPGLVPSPAMASPLNATADDPSSSVLVPGRSTETSTTWREPDGSYSVEAFSTPINYRDGKGVWHEINNDLVDTTDPAFAVENAANDYEVSIPADASATPIRFATNDEWVTMRMHGVDSSPTVVGSEATFVDVQSADQVTYVATSEGLKETITLGAPPSAPDANPAFAYDLRMSAGLEPALRPDGSISFRSAAGKTVIQMPAGVMVDSAKPAQAVSSAVRYDLARVSTGYRLTVTPDPAWLAAPTRVYPVAIDPSLVKPTASQDCWVREIAPNDNYCGTTQTRIRTGRTGVGERYHGLLNFDVSSVPAGASITSAWARLWLDSSYTLNTGDISSYALYRAGQPFDDHASWNTSGAAGAWSGGRPTGIPSTPLSMNGGGASGYRTFDGMSEIVQGWVNGTYARNGLVLRQSPESGNNIIFFRSASTDPVNDGMRPFLVINYTMPVSNPASAVLTGTIDSAVSRAGGLRIEALESDTDSDAPLGTSLRSFVVPDSAVSVTGSNYTVTLDPTRLPPWTMNSERYVDFNVTTSDANGNVTSANSTTVQVVTDTSTGVKRWNNPAADGTGTRPADSLDTLTEVIPDSAQFDPSGTDPAADSAVEADFAEHAFEAAPISFAPSKVDLSNVSAAAPDAGEESETASAADATTDAASAQDVAGLEAARASCPAGGAGTVPVQGRTASVTIGTGYPVAGDSSWMSFNRNSDESSHLQMELGGAVSYVGLVYKKQKGITRSSSSTFVWDRKDYARSYRVNVVYRRYNAYIDRCPSDRPISDVPEEGTAHDPYYTYWRAWRVTSVPGGENRGIAIPNFGTSAGFDTGTDSCQRAGSAGTWSREKSNGRSYSYDKGAHLGDILGFELSVKRAYNSQARLYYHVSKGLWLNGNNDLPEWAGKIQEATKPGSGCIYS
jgi:hypothetical protein